MDHVIANSRTMIRKGSKSFSAASRLFDRETRESAYMLYAWCRYCDDQVDGQELGFGISAKAADTAAERLEITLAQRRVQEDVVDILLNLKHTGGNRSKAAKVMDIQRTYLSRLITRYEIRDLA